MSAQTDTADLHWYIAVDVRAPAGIEKRIAKAIAPAKAIVWRRNAFFSGLNPVDKEELTKRFGDQDIIVTRIDDDDLLHRNFVAEARREMLNDTGLSAVTFSDGLDLTLSDMKAAHTRYPWIAAGLCIKSSARAVVTPYDMKHTRTAGWISRRKGAAREVRGSPMWVRVWHSASDSTEARGLRNAGGPNLKIEWSEFGLSAANLTALQKISRGTAPAPKRTHSFSRLEMKLAVVKQIKSLRTQSEAAGIDEKLAKKLQKDAKRLLEVLYCI